MNLTRLLPSIFILWMLATQSVLLLPISAAADDTTINGWVQAALREDPDIDATDITVNTQDGIVTLSGSVSNLTAKHDVDLEVKTISGVRGVINALQVIPVSRSDADIEQDVRHRLINSAAITSQEIRVTVKAAVVTLDGQVPSWLESQEAELLAGQTRGVKAVTNHLQVNYPAKRPDTDIQKDVVAAISRDLYLAGLPIMVSVKDGVITLQGQVESAYQKERADRDLRWVWNVAGVQNRLQVIGPQGRRLRKPAPLPTDAQLKDALQDELKADQRLQPSDVTVQVQQGEITLRGTVPSYVQKRVAEQDARDVVGVVAVNNLLMVRTLRRADDVIQADVEFQLNSDYGLDTDVVDVQVHNGVVTLLGVVHSPAERSHAEALASRVKGVRQIVNHISVETGSAFTDASIAGRIKDWLAATAETQGVANQIKVTVEAGRVTLTGQVNFWSERVAAGNVARQTDGVRVVDNQLGIVSAEGGG
jgi:osmotically-inducible protein OsmY